MIHPYGRQQAVSLLVPVITVTSYGHHGVSFYRQLHRLLRISKKTSKLHVTDLCEGNPLVTGGFSHKGPVTQKIFPFDDVIMAFRLLGAKPFSDPLMPHSYPTLSEQIFSEIQINCIRKCRSQKCRPFCLDRVPFRVFWHKQVPVNINWMDKMERLSYRVNLIYRQLQKEGMLLWSITLLTNSVFLMSFNCMV